MKIVRGTLTVFNGFDAFWLYGYDEEDWFRELACLGDGVGSVPQEHMDDGDIPLEYFGTEDELAEAYGFELVDGER